jgi:hypothetical protein
MDDSKRNEGHEKRIKYIRPELIFLDKDKGIEGVISCSPTGSSATDGCVDGAAVGPGT